MGYSHSESLMGRGGQKRRREVLKPVLRKHLLRVHDPGGSRNTFGTKQRAAKAQERYQVLNRGKQQFRLASAVGSYARALAHWQPSLLHLTQAHPL